MKAIRLLKSWQLVIGLVLIWLIFIVPISLAYEDLGKPTGLVNDYADILTTEQKSALENKLSTFREQSKHEIAVVIIKSLAGDTIENFATQLFAAWGIGQQGADNGVLLLIAIDDRQMRIEVGYGLEGALTDAQSSWIINEQLKPNFQKNDFYTGIDQAMEQIMKATSGEVIPSNSNINERVESDSFNVFADVIKFFIFFMFIFLSRILAKTKSWWLGGVIGAGVGLVVGWVMSSIIATIAGVLIIGGLGLIIDYVLSNKKIGPGGGILFGGGGFGGGRSGGGFGGFGGGGSGGGGSSGSW